MHTPSLPTRRVLAATLATLFLGLAPMAAGASDVTFKSECADGVCSGIVEDQSFGVEPCAGAVILLAWRQSGGATLIQCLTQDADMDKPSYVYNRDLPAAPAYPLIGMRFFVSKYLGDLASGKVADKFSSHALCQPPKPPRMASGELLLGEKVPTGEDKNPYCYRVLRVSTTSAGVLLTADDKDSPKAEAKHADWDKLASKVTALIQARSGAAPMAATATKPADAARVAHAKAPLRDSPDAGAAPHGYLVQGDEVTVLDRSKAADGWVKARYVGKSGKAIERWIRADDLEAAAAH